MPKRRQSPQSSRRNFLKGASLLGAVGAVTPPVAAGAVPVAPLEKLMAAVPGPRQMAAETMAPTKDPVNQSTSGGDFMADVLNSLGIEYLTINCASSFRGLHEAVLNHSGN
jgi:acetolactate synthase I/II/III large subunit